MTAGGDHELAVGDGVLELVVRVHQRRGAADVVRRVGVAGVAVAAVDALSTPDLRRRVGRVANQPARPESGVLGVGAFRHWARAAATSGSSATQPRKSACHSSIEQRSRRLGVPARAPRRRPTSRPRRCDATAATHDGEHQRPATRARAPAPSQASMSGDAAGRLDGRAGRRRRRGVEVVEQAVDVGHVDPHLLHPAVDVAHDELAEAEPRRRGGVHLGQRGQHRLVAVVDRHPQQPQRLGGDLAGPRRSGRRRRWRRGSARPGRGCRAGSARRPARPGSTCGSRGRAGPGTTGRSASPP